ncbi:MAG: chorismate synthase [Eubacterium sp.]|nr:chorismate synthase [Eubacterium sp.]
MSSVIGNKLKLSVFGESHGSAIGCVLDGVPAGLELDMQRIYLDMKRRAPGRDKTSTPRVEKDMPVILSGVLEGVTTGAPLAMIIENQNTKSEDYKNIQSTVRPSHSDYPAYVKYGGNNDVRGGGHFSGRLTAPLVFAGAVAKQILAQKGVTVGAHIMRIGSETDEGFDLNAISAAQLNALSQMDFSVINADAEGKMRAQIESARSDGDSIGGIIECAAVGLPVGIGSNMFDTLEGELSRMLFAVPAVKGVEFGRGFELAKMLGSQANDGYCIKDGEISTITNNNGGVLGGMSNGAPLVFRAVIKPTPSISKPQKTVNVQTLSEEILEVKGRHDPCIVHRAVPVIEAATALVLADLML